MIDDFALWLGCNAMTQDLTLCAINTVLILPGLLGMGLMFVIYLIAIPLLFLSMIKRGYLRLRGIK